MAPANDTQLTPMMAQYRRIKGELPKDALLLFRLGDFYEMFFEDAQEGAQILNVALTKRGIVPMCGIPHHAAHNYITRLLKAGRKVALCDQIEDARPGQLVKREVTQILSPGTHFDERMLVAEQNNYLAAIYPAGNDYGLAVIDLTTGDFRATELEGEQRLLAELDRLRPAELILPTEQSSLENLLRGRSAALSSYEGWTFAVETAQFTLLDHFKVATLDGFGLKQRPAAVAAAGGALHYLTQNLRRDASHLTRISFYLCTDYLILDAATLRMLEILESQSRDAPAPATLFAALNRCATPMGARRLRDWLTQPLAVATAIHRRQDAIAAWIQEGSRLDSLREALGPVRDLERTLSRLSVGSCNGRDLLSLRAALDQVPRLKLIVEDTDNAVRAAQSAGMLQDGSRLLPLPELAAAPVAAGGGSGSEINGPAQSQLGEDSGITRDAAVSGSQKPSTPLLRELAQQLAAEPDLTHLIARAVADEPPLALKEGGLIRDGFDPALDELRRAGREGKEWIAKLQQDEIERTGIPSLKVRFNSVFGYYIEVTKANLERVPAHYIRKQTIANGERYITPELKEMEGKILGAEERGVKLEYELFLRVREAVLERVVSIQRTAGALAQLDVLASFAETARLHGYCRPRVADAGVLRIRDGRHPVLEQSASAERFVPNDTELDVETVQIGLITGPNMAGKSTFIRQVALLALLAHTGSFVPAAEARIDLIDRIFTRIGASDDLARGQSTFMVEMSETANILNNAKRSSLIVLDEIGRGTSTFDGLSLAWAIVEHLHNQIGAKTLFATHYHELTELAGRLSRLRNYNVAVREWHEQIVFLHKIIPGGTDKSYGIHVARLAGLPRAVLDRSKEILRNLEDSELTPEGKVRHGARHRAERERLQQLTPPPQLDLFSLAPPE